MIKKLKRRYLITNMLLLSSTLLVCLAVLFGFLYHSEVSSSYTVMQQMIKEAEMPERPPEDADHVPMVQNADDADFAVLLSGEADDCDFDYEWNGFETYHMQPPPYWDTQMPGQPPGDWNRGSWQEPPDWDDWYEHGAPPWQNDDDNDNRYENPPPEQQPQYTAPPQEMDPAQTMTRPADEPQMTDRNGCRREPAQTVETQQTRPAEETRPPRNDNDYARSDSNLPPDGCRPTTETDTVPPEPPRGDSGNNVPATKDTPPAPPVPVREGQYIPDAFLAQIDNEGNVSSYAGNDGSTSDDDRFRTVNSAMDEVKRRGASAGTVEIGDNSYRFLYQPDDSGNFRLVLLDRTLELSTISKLLFIFILITILGLLIMFGSSVLLANWTVAPVATAWEKQKQFVADASHELKTPLAVISANTEVILSDPAQSVAGQSKWLNYIQSETMRMSKLITNLLSVARMDSDDKHKVQAPPISLSETVSNVCLVFEPIIYENGKTLNTVIQRNVMFRAEEDNLKQLLSILLDNAVLHSVPRAQITVSLSRDTQGKIRLTVSNTAKDIPPEQLAHLFDRFYRVDTEGSPNGSGLGLSIAKSIVHQMGGALSVTSENQLVTFSAVFSS